MLSSGDHPPRAAARRPGGDRRPPRAHLRREYGVDPTFEAHVAASVAEAGRRGFPAEREGLWIVEAAGRHAGSIALTDEGDGVATVRWVVLDPGLRGRGLGRRLLGEVVAEAEGHGYRLLKLETFSELRAAAHLYREHGFELISAETGPRWGRARDHLPALREELPAPCPGLELGAAPARARRPFSVSA